MEDKGFVASIGRCWCLWEGDSIGGCFQRTTGAHKMGCSLTLNCAKRMNGMAQRSFFLFLLGGGSLTKSR